MVHDRCKLCEKGLESNNNNHMEEHLPNGAFERTSLCIGVFNSIFVPIYSYFLR